MSSSACPRCGAPAASDNQFCSHCGTPLQPQHASQNTQQQPPPPYTAPPHYAPPPPYGGYSAPKSRLVAGLLGLFIGGFGIHNFYLGYTTRGVIQIVATILTCGLASLWGFIEAILILTGSIPTDARGVPLVD